MLSFTCVFIHWNFQFQHSCLVLLKGFYFFVKFLTFFMNFPPDFIKLSFWVFLIAHRISSKEIFWIFFYQPYHKILSLNSFTEGFFFFFLIFWCQPVPWVFLFLVVLQCCIHTGSSRHLLKSSLVTFVCWFCYILGFLQPCMHTPSLHFLEEFLSFLSSLVLTAQPAGCRTPLFCFPEGGAVAQVCSFSLSTNNSDSTVYLTDIHFRTQGAGYTVGGRRGLHLALGAL